MMRLLVDTEVLYLLLTQSERLGKPCLSAIEEASANGSLCISVASLLQLREASREGLVAATELAKIETWMDAHQAQILPIDVKVLSSMSRTSPGETVADRLILATARSEDCRLATFRRVTEPEIEFLFCEQV